MLCARHISIGNNFSFAAKDMFISVPTTLGRKMYALPLYYLLPPWLNLSPMPCSLPICVCANYDVGHVKEMEIVNGIWNWKWSSNAEMIVNL